MSVRNRIMSMVVVLAFMGITGCGSTPSTIVLQTDPTGADVQEETLGLLGQSPLTRTFTEDELKRLRVNMTLNLEISKRGFITERVTVSLPRGGEVYQMKQQLLESHEFIDITSDPDGVAVFLQFIEGPLFNSANSAARKTMMLAEPNKVVKRFLGNTPIRYKDDPAQPLKEDDYLVFEKEGYKSHDALFKAKEKRLHIVMQK